MPTASTRPNSVSVLIEKPNADIAAKLPMIATGTAMTGISAARQVCRNSTTTITTSSKASSSRSEEHTSELQSLMRISYAVFCLKKKKNKKRTNISYNQRQQL